MRKFVWVSFVGMLGLSNLWAIDKAAIEDNVRKSLNLTTKQKITVGDPVVSDFANLEKADVMIDGGTYPIYLAPDGKQYFWGQVFDLSKDPDKEREQKISLADVWAKGSPKAPVVIVEYTDLQCPYCSKAHQTINESLYKTYTKDQVRFVYKQFPLNMHDWAEKAAVVTECVGKIKPDYFWKAVDYYYEKQESIKAANFSEKTATLLADLKVSTATVEACQAEPDMLAKVRKDRDEGASIGVGGTPTFIINGRMLRGSRFEDMKTVIDEKMPESAKATKAGKTSKGKK